MIFRSVVTVLAAALAMASIAPAYAAAPALEGKWRQTVVCRGDRTVDFVHRLKIYRDHSGLRFKAFAPIAANSTPNPRSYVVKTPRSGYFDGASSYRPEPTVWALSDGFDANFYYGDVEVADDVVTLRISPRYKRDYWRNYMTSGERLAVQDARYRITPNGELTALGSGRCETTPFKPVGRHP